MKKIQVVFIILLLFGVSSILNVYAANVEIVGRVINGNFVAAGSSVIFTDSLSKKQITQTVVDPHGLYSVSIPQGTYDITIIPPPQSGLKEATQYNQKVETNREITLSLPYSPENSLQKQQMTWMGSFFWSGVIALAIILVGMFFLLKRRR